MTLLTRSASFSNPLGQELQFYGLRGTDELSALFEYEVDLLSANDAIDLSALLGKNCSVLLERTDGSVRAFNGLVTDFSLVGEHGRLARYRAVLRPWLWLLGLSKNSRIFQARTGPEVVKEIFREWGCNDVEDALSSKYRKWEYLVQYRESDLSFVSRVLEQEGIHYFFKHEHGKHSLVLADSNDAHTTDAGYQRVPYFPPLARERRQDEHLDTLRASRQVRPGRVTAFDFQFKDPKIVAAVERSPFDAEFPEFEVFDFPAEVENDDEAATQARLRLEELQVEYETVEGGGPVRGLAAGSRFFLTQFPREDQNREYSIVRAAYDVRVSEYESNVIDDEPPILRFEFVGIDAKRPFRPARRTTKPRVRGPHTAVVCGPEGTEIHTDQYGRVRVKFHWDRAPDANETSSCYVRVSQLWAGEGWGGQHLPRIGQEVIVDFLEGDPDRPIIVGRVYNQAQPPPYPLPAKATQSGIKSRSSPKGTGENFNELRFEDKLGSEEFHFQAEKDMSTLVKNDQSTTVKANRSAGVGHDDSVSVKGDRSVSVGGNLSVTVSGGGKSPVHSTHSVTGKHSVEASDTIEISAPTHISFTVGKSMVLLTPAGIAFMAETGAALALDANVFTMAKGEANLMLDQNAGMAAKGKAALFLDNNVNMVSAGQSQLLLDGCSTIYTLGDLKMKGKKVAGVGKELATFALPTSAFDLNGDASSLASGMINVNGMGMVSIMGTSVKVN